MNSELKIVVSQRDGVSHTSSVYVTPPFRAVSTAALREDGWEQLMIMSSSPGMLSGDNYQIDIDVKDGTKLCLESQSYFRIFNMEGKAVQNSTIKIGNNAHFSYIPHPIVPHKSSKFYATTRVDIGRNSSFLQSEIITCGRKYFGEMFVFDHFHSSTQLFFEGKIVLFDNILLSPKTMDISSIGLLEGYSHQATLLFGTTTTLDVKEFIETVYAHISEHKKNSEILFGISKSQTNGFVIRALANGGDTLFSIFKEIENIVTHSLTTI